MRDGIILALLTSVLWGITPIFDKLGVAKASPTAIMAIRFSTTFLCILPLFLMPGVRAEIRSLDSRTLGYIIVAAVLSAILGICMYFMAMKRMEATRVTAICATYPLVTFILGVVFLQEGISWTKAVGTILTVAGIVFLSL